MKITVLLITSQANNTTENDMTLAAEIAQDARKILKDAGIKAKVKSRTWMANTDEEHGSVQILLDDLADKSSIHIKFFIADHCDDVDLLIGQKL
jgi:hypothetical protein